MFNWVRDIFSSLKKSNRQADSDTRHPEMSAIAGGVVENKECGDALMRDGDLQLAAKCYRQALAVDSGYAAAHLCLGMALMQQGVAQEARHHLERARELDPVSADADYLLGQLSAIQGQMVSSEAHFRKALQRSPDFLPVYGDLCRLLMQSGRIDDATQLIRDGLRHHPGDAELHFFLGSVFFEQGKWDMAVSIFKTAIIIDPAYAQAFANIGLTLFNIGSHDQAAVALQRAISLNPDSADTYNNLGSALHAQGKFEEAIAVFRRGLVVAPGAERLHGNLGLSLHAFAKLEGAIRHYREALTLNPDLTQTYFHLGNALFAQREMQEAIAAFKAFLHREPHRPEACINLGNAFLETGDATAALASFEQALEIDPDCAVAHYGKGIAFRSLAQTEEAETCLQQAVEIDPDLLAAHSSLAVLLCNEGKLEAAAKSYLRVLEIEPQNEGARWTLAVLKIPAIADTIEEVMASRQKFSHAVDDLRERMNAGEMAMRDLDACNLLPFYLTYQEENNRDLLAAHGALRARLAEAWAGQHLSPVLPECSGKKLRVGIVSAHIIKNHSVWIAIVKGWFDHLDPERFELHTFYTGTLKDEETTWASKRSASFEMGNKEFGQWAGIIQEKRVDVLIYPEIGMDLLTAKLASMRLAPIQVATWGHPETSGLSTIDYFLSAEDLEPPNAQDNYTEKLILLPQLGCHYYPAKVKSVDPDLIALRVNPSVPLLLCPGSPFKYAPQYDAVFTEIAQRLGKCQFIFFSGHLPALNEKLRARLQSAFEKADLNFDEYCVILPWLNKPLFYGLMKLVDVFLDTIGFSGFNTAIQALECDLPIVTREGRFMRGRLASGILRRMGLSELVASDEAKYVDLVVKLVQDASYRNAMRQRIASSRSILFHDVSSIRALEAFLISTSARLNMVQTPEQ